MKIRVIAVLCVCAVLVPLVVFFFLRAPVLIIGDEEFETLYGKERLRAQYVRVCAALRRPVKRVTVDSRAGDDVIALAAARAEEKPCCVIFPWRYRQAALRYNDQFPETPAVVLPGREHFDADETAARKMFFQFAGDTELDLYRAGLCAALLGGSVAALPEQGMDREPVSGDAAGAAVILPDSGGAVPDGNSAEYPVLFTWLDPALLSRAAAVVFDDSPWAQAAAAVRLVEDNQKTGKIPAKVVIFSDKIADNAVLRVLKKASRAAPEKNAVPGL